MNILTPILVLGGLGLCFGVGLAIASRRFAIKTDPRLELVHGLLPGSNCGACGGAGCFGFAENLLSGKSNISACRVSDKALKKRIAEILGTSVEERTKTVAALHCCAGSKVKDKYIYQGIADCVAANLLLGGPKECVWGCMGFGTCVAVCPFGALSMNDDRLPVVDGTKCTACGKCVIICPKRLFRLIPAAGPIIVACSSHAIGRDVMKVCPVGCIACRKCEQACKAGAIRVIDNLAVVDYTKCTDCGECITVCPTKVIKKL